MTKEIKLGKEAREELKKGIDILANSVTATLGPNGRNVLLDQYPNPPISTKDGVTVAKHIEVKDKFQNLGIQTLKAAATKTADKAGDGTTTSTLLAQSIANEGLDYLDKGFNAVEIKRGMDAAVKEVIDCLKSQISQKISSEEQLEQIASISANNDIEIGKLISSAIEKVGKDGVVHIESSKSGETYLETVEGMQLDRGYKSHFFVTDNDSMTCFLEDALILIADHRFSNVKELLPILEKVSSEGKSLLIIAEDIDNEALATLIVNKGRGTLKVCAIKAPDFGDRRKLILEDVATLTGGVVFDKNKGMKLDRFSWEWFGNARAVTVSKDQTTIVDGKGDENAILERTTSLQKQIDNATSPYEIEQLQTRLAKMSGGVSIIHVGGYNETEMQEKKDRVDDALHATKAALAEGIVPGGGSALLYAREAITTSKDNSNSFNTGKEIIYRACGAPFHKILTNAGFGANDMFPILMEIGKLGEVGTKPYFGFNLKNETVDNMVELGIIDPTKVTRTALQNAASVAGTLLLTECAVVPDESEDNQNDNPLAGLM